MKATIFSCLVLLSPVILAPAMWAQEEGYGGVYGYSSIDYDPDSNTITAYSETDMDSEFLPYYEPMLSVSVTDEKNNNYDSSCK